jgi:TolB protein
MVLNVIDTIGQNQIQLTDFSRKTFAPSWSPSGRYILFESNHDRNCEIYLMKADGTDVIRLTNDEASDGVPRWQQ